MKRRRPVAVRFTCARIAAARGTTCLFRAVAFLGNRSILDRSARPITRGPVRRHDLFLGGKMHKIIASLSLLVQSLLILACCVLPAQALPSFDPADAPPAPDYSQRSSWLAIPDGAPDKAMDVFWVYPTVLMDDDHWLMELDDAASRKGAQRTIDQQASVFTENANLYAPLYRQMNLAGLSLSDEEREERLSYAHKDVKNALLYYISHYNNGRPFIIAGHSQGSNILTDIMVDSWGSLDGEKNMVAAYLIGWSITGQDLEHNPRMRICKSADQTGCFITYNSIAPGKQDVAPTILPGAVVVNPLSWTTDTERAPATRNLGAVFFSDNGEATVYPHFASAQVQNGGLAVIPADTSRVQCKGSSFPEGVYHVYDYSLFYENLKANAMERLRAFESKSQ
ncbi:DUF3089 domain-containing protein [Oceanidesulfovibrio marinus]|uniref:DUF3089 domain-containing protein n=2 Tax=Oceanidesulfovibrio marinus TaxID=370038 RepID=A0A6P1ZFI6_9BACT|nr:DUF3089 domain-containing protein [Oceanidesulfovibrio marinus]